MRGSGSPVCACGDLVIEKDRRPVVFWCVSVWKAGYYPLTRRRPPLYPSPWALPLSATGGTDTVPARMLGKTRRESAYRTRAGYGGYPVAGAIVLENNRRVASTLAEPIFTRLHNNNI